MVAGPSKVQKPTAEKSQGQSVASDERKEVDVYNATNWCPYLSPEARVAAMLALTSTKITEQELYEATRIFMRQRLHEDPPLSLKELRDVFKWLQSVSFYVLQCFS